MEILLKNFIKIHWINPKDKVLVVCGGEDDNRILKKIGFSNYLITSAYKHAPTIACYQQADAQHLPFNDNSFDIAIVNCGLHHCASPHQALCEMYRVAKKAVIVSEAQDSLLVRLMVKLKLIQEYEFDAVNLTKKSGGLNNSSIPNFVYRWTKREIEKTINSYDPTRYHQIKFYRSFRYYFCFLESGYFWENKIFVKLLGKKNVGIVINIVVFILNLIAKNNGNFFAFIIRKNISPLHPWIKIRNKQLIYKPK